MASTCIKHLSARRRTAVVEVAVTDKAVFRGCCLHVAIVQGSIRGDNRVAASVVGCGSAEVLQFGTGWIVQGVNECVARSLTSFGAK